MGLMSKILGGGSRTVDDYVEIDLDDVAESVEEAQMRIRIAEVDGHAASIDIKDAVYDGDIVVADMTRLRTKDQTTEHILDELRQVVKEVDGDIVQKGDEQLIVAPTGVRIDREKIGG
ncbi:MAG: cell division protein SepF [Natrialbaceae archaeon]|nr:cell division protein SepF [Natrialbaceae archaeon]